MSEQKIRRDMTFGELIQKFPKAAPVLAGYGMHCIGCHISTMETIEQGARAHGMNETMLAKMMDELNQSA